MKVDYRNNDCCFPYADVKYMGIRLCVQISSPELALCLGLSANTRYRMKDQKETEPTLVMDVTSEETPACSAVKADTTYPDKKHKDSSMLDSVPLPMLPPRKRLKASRTELSSGSNTEVRKLGHTEGRCENFDVGTLLESQRFSGSQPDVTECLLPASQASVASSNTAASVDTSDATIVRSFSSTAENRFASFSAPMQPVKTVPFQRQSVRSGRKSQPIASVAVTANPHPTVVCESWMAHGDNKALSIVSSTPPPTVAASTPNLIPIPDDARVFQTEDGMVIVCQSDGTVQIHGHTEGQPIPIDAIQSLLGLDAAGDQTLYAVSDQEASQALYGQSVPLTRPQSGYETAEHMIAADGTQNVIPVDGAMYGNQPLVAFDPNTHSMVQLDPGQTFITLADGNTLVAVDGSQPVLPIEGACPAEQGVISNSALLQLLPQNNKQ